MSYTFNLAQPPLLADYPNILSVPSALLRSKSLFSHQQPNSAIGSEDSQHDHWQWYFTFVLEAYKEWVMTAIPYHCALDKVVKTEVMNGYDKTSMTTFEQSLSATAGASGFGMSGSVTVDLDLTDQETQSWQQSVTTDTEVTYLAGNTYCSWSLEDVLILNAQKMYQYEYKGASPPGYTPQGVPVVTTVRNVLANFGDSVPDPTGADVPSLTAFMSHPISLAIRNLQ